MDFETQKGIVNFNHPLFSDIKSMKRNKASFPLQALIGRKDFQLFSSSLGYISYKRKKDFLLVAGDPLALEPFHQKKLFQKFQDWAEGKGLGICGYYFSESFFTAFKEESFFSFHPIGPSVLVDLKSFTFQGSQRRDLRRALRKGKNYDFKEILKEDQRKWLFPIKSLEHSWRTSRKLKKMGFLISDFIWEKEDRWFVVLDKGEIQAFVSLCPYGNSYYVDSMIYRPEGASMALDFLISQLILSLQKEERDILSLGLSPFWDLWPDSFWKTFFWILQKTSCFYNFQGLGQFKKKFASEMPMRYLLLNKKRSSLAQMVVLGQASLRVF